jgi:hypothetical protein
MGPLSCGELALSALIQFTVGFAGPQAIAETQRPLRFRASLREDMQVDIRVWPCQHAVLVPAGVPGHQPVASELGAPCPARAELGKTRRKPRKTKRAGKNQPTASGTEVARDEGQTS